MTTPKFTPGPWNTNGLSVRAPQADAAIAMAPIDARSNWANNATLIASAPDLYAALEAFEEQLEQLAFMYPEGEWTAVLNQTRAALAKARGMKGGE